MAGADPRAAGEPSSGVAHALLGVGGALLGISRPFWAACAAAWVALIWYLSEQTVDRVPAGPLWRYLANGMHVPLFGLLALWISLALPRSGRSPDESGSSARAGDGRWPRLGVATSLGVVALVSAFGAIDEWHQSWTGRNPSVTDWLTDTVAAAWVVAVAANVARPGAAAGGVRRCFWSGLVLCLVAVALATWA
jgi:hypothetical protein